MKTVIIVGTGASLNQLNPDHYPDAEYWGLNNHHITPEVADIPFTRWFELHNLDLIKANPNNKPESIQHHLDWLNTTTLPVYMFPHHPHNFPTYTPYPVDDILNFLPVRYLTSTPAWETALAIWEGFERIGIYGVDLVTGTEYAYQRPCLEFLLGIAWAKNIDIVIPTGSELLKASHLYGYEDHTTFAAKLAHRETELTERLQKAQQQYWTLKGALDQVQATKRFM